MSGALIADKRGAVIVDMRGRPLHRKYAASVQDRLTADFNGSTRSANQEIAASLAVTRARSRQLCMDNDYAKRFLGMVSANVVGANGITMQSSASLVSGKPDKKLRTLVESKWRDWGESKHCTMAGRHTWRDVQNQVIQAIARDGECLVRIVRGGNLKYGMALHVVSADYLPINYSVNEKNKQITMGIEHDGYGRPLFYHLHVTHPGENNGYDQKYEKVAAGDIIHLYRQDSPGQQRGMPWFHTSIRRLNMIGKYEEAELVAAREAAAKMGFYTSPDGDGYIGEEDVKGNLISESEPGMFEQLPDGVQFTAYDPQHPVAAFGAFIKAVLRGAASGLGVSYNTLANDLEGVNFSSIRSGVLEEREQWKSLQQWFIDQFCKPVYAAWLPQAVRIDSDLQTHYESKRDRMEQTRWQGRGWPWVDPLKDQQANREALSLGVMTRTDMAAMQGKDLEEIFEQLQRENEMAEQYGLNFNQDETGGTNAEKDD